MEPEDSVRIEFYDGAQWFTVKTIAGTVNWTSYEVDLPALTSGLQQFRFASGMNENTDFSYIDSITITGTAR